MKKEAFLICKSRFENEYLLFLSLILMTKIYNIILYTEYLMIIVYGSDREALVFKIIYLGITYKITNVSNQHTCTGSWKWFVFHRCLGLNIKWLKMCVLIHLEIFGRLLNILLGCIWVQSNLMTGNKPLQPLLMNIIGHLYAFNLLYV